MSQKYFSGSSENFRNISRNLPENFQKFFREICFWKINITIQLQQTLHSSANACRVYTDYTTPNEQNIEA